VWYRSSGEAGHDWGEYNFGNMLFDGRGVARDVVMAMQWYLRAANKGHGRAMNLVARCLEEGWGCVKSPVEAADWYRRSAEAGYFRAQFNYAVLLAERGNPAAAADWFWEAAWSGDDAIRQTILSKLAETRDPELVALRERLTEREPRCRVVAPSLAPWPGDAIDNHSYLHYCKPIKGRSSGELPRVGFAASAVSEQTRADDDVRVRVPRSE
jgi:hypothetical protein